MVHLFYDWTNSADKSGGRCEWPGLKDGLIT